MANKQDQTIADTLTTWGQILDRIQNTPALLTALSGRGYPTQRIAQIQSKHQTAVTAYQNRHTAINAQKQASTHFQTALATNKKENQQYRKILKKIGLTPADLQTIHASGIVPRDLQRYILQTRAGYHALANNPTLLSQTTPLGYGPTQLATMVTALDTLLTLHNHQKTTQGQAQAATQTRNTHYTNLKKEMALLLTIATILAEGHPDWLTLLQTPTPG